MVGSGLAQGDVVVMGGAQKLLLRPKSPPNAGECRVMKGFNLSEWAMNHRSFVWYLMILFVVAGVLSYIELGREEDPAFAVNTMLVMTSWPGATTVDTMQQVTDRIETKLEETPKLDYTKSYTTPGVSASMSTFSITPASVPEIWYQVRKKVADIKQTLPSGVVGPFFNDEFGDVFGMIYGLTSDGFTERELRDFAEQAFARAPDPAGCGQGTTSAPRTRNSICDFDTRSWPGWG